MNIIASQFRLQNGYLILALLSLMILLIVGISPAEAQVPISFDTISLNGEASNNPTSLQFGPDGRLYVSQVDGTIYAYNIERTEGPVAYNVIQTEAINLVKNIQNHNDDGSLNGNDDRQVTGILVTGTAANPVIYASSSDPRIGAGGGGNDVNLDTNSGVISRLTCTGGMDGNNECISWTHVELVRGLPRSEENHATNGMAMLDANTLLVAVGGSTNAGSPSNNFAQTVEYAYSAAIVQIDLAAIGNTTHELATLDDPTRANVNGITDPSDPGYDGIDVNDPFGGNDGMNQAIIDPSSPVQLYSTGYRNLYDIVMASNGFLYGVDNGANGGWGGFPEYEESYNCTTNFLAGEPGSNGNGPNPATYPAGVTLHDGLNGTVASDGNPDSQVNNKNGLHRITPGYYGGHPNPLRGNPAGSGLWYNGTYYAPGHPNLPANWPPVPVGMANPVECDFQNSGVDDGAIANYGPSTNGITEYTASNFDGQLEGVLLAAGFSGSAPIYEMHLNATGDVVTNCPANPVNNCNDTLFSGFGSQPLDVTAQGDGDVFPGTVWAAVYGADTIIVFEPVDFANCAGADDDTIDEDNDLYTNADEIDNGTDPCNGGSQPDDFDDALEYGAGNAFKLSDLNDADDDNDGINDPADHFAWDVNNGTTTNLPIEYELFNEFPSFGFGGLGFTGLMNNGTTDYLDQFIAPELPDGTIFGGTAGLLTIPLVSEGDSYETNNLQENAFQFGINVDASTGPFTIASQINGPFFDGNAAANYQSQGIFIGTGDQNNYVKLVLRHTNSATGFEVLTELNASASSTAVNLGAGVLSNSAIQMYFEVDPVAGTVQPQYSLDNGPIQNAGPVINLSGVLLDVVQGNYTNGGQNSALAVGAIATSFNVAEPFAATWDYFRVTENASGAQSVATINTGGINGSTYGGGFSIENTSTAGQEITQVVIDFSTAVIPEVVFDPDGNAGDATAKPFEPSGGSDTTTGVTSHSFSNAYEGGFYTLTINFDDFQPGETLNFALDVDPISIKGGSAPGPNESGSVSGLELTGSTFTVEYDGSELQSAEIYRIQPSSAGGATNIVRPNLPAAPSIEMLGQNTQTVTNDDTQIIRVSGAPGSDVSLLQFEAGLFVEDLNGPYANVGYDIDPWEVNSIIAINEFDGTIDANGFIDFPVTLTDSDPEAGYNIFSAVVVDSNDGATSDVSNVVIVEYDIDAVVEPNFALRINAGGAQYTDTNGDVWEADNYFLNGTVYPTNNPIAEPIADTLDDFLYQTERYGGEITPLNYAIPVPGDGQYTVNLLMAEIYIGNINPNLGVGDRIFDVSIEGNVVLDDYDLFADQGTLDAVIHSFDVSVTGTLDISVSASVDNGKISAIEVLGIVGNVPPTLAPVADQTHNEGDAIDFFVSASDADNDTLSYAISGQPSGVEIEPTNGHIFGTIDAGAATGSPYTVTVTVDDGNTSPVETTFEWIVINPNTNILYRVNNGGEEIADTPIPWAADQAVLDADASGSANPGAPSPYLVLPGTVPNGMDETYGTAYNGNNALGVPTDLFIHERYNTLTPPNNMQWEFPVPAGDYLVNLYFVENWTGAQTPGIRVFDVEVEGVLALDDYDIYVAAGNSNAALVESIPVTVTDGTLDVDFIQGAQNPKVNAIEIVSVGAAVDTPPVVDPIADVNITEGLVAQASVSTTELDGDAVTLGIDIPGVDPLDYSFTDNGDGTGDFSWQTVTGDAGTYTATVTATDKDGSNIETFEINVIEPVAGGEVLFRVNVGGEQVAAADASSPDWSADTSANPSPYISAGGTQFYNGNSGNAHPGAIVMTDPSIPPSAPAEMFNFERWDQPTGAEMLWQFPVAAGTEIEVRLFFAELFSGVDVVGERSFDVSIDGVVPAEFNDLDPFAIAGAKGAFMRSVTITSDGTVDIEFLHDIIENPNVKGIEIVTVGEITREVQLLAPSEGETIIGDTITVEWSSVSPETSDHIHVLIDDPLVAGDEFYQGSLPVAGSIVSDPLPPGDYTITVTMADTNHAEYPETAQTVNVTLLETAPNLPPVVTNPGTQNSNEGSVVNLPIVATAPELDQTVSYAAVGLPPSLSINPVTGVISGTIDAGSPSSAGAFIESGGTLVIEVESIPPAGGWVDSTTIGDAVPNALGDYYEYLGPDTFNAGGINPANNLVYPIEITTPGLYRFQYRTQAEPGQPQSEHNDSWVQIEGTGATAVAYLGGFDGGAPDTTMGNNFFKAWMQSPNDWTWTTYHVDGAGQDVYFDITQPGNYNVIISGRSNMHKVDRFALYLDELDYSPSNLTSLPATPFTPGDSGTPGASAGSPYNVTVTVTDNGDPAEASDINFVWNVGSPNNPSVTILVNDGSTITASTFGNNSYEISNTGDVDITSISFNSSTAFLPDVAFDPVGTAGDAVSQCIVLGAGGANGTGYITPADPCVNPFSQFHNGVDVEEGYDVATLNFNGFNPGENINFGVDMDPTSIKGDSDSGDAGSISGFELVGMTVTVNFADGTTLVGNLWEQGNLGGSELVLELFAPATPSIAAQGILTDKALVTDPNQTIVVSGPAGASVELLQVDGRLYIDAGGGGYDLDPFEANEAMASILHTGTIGAGGTLDIPVTLLTTDGASTPLSAGPDGGINHFIAVITESGQNSQTSNTIVLEIDPDAAQPVIAPIADLLMDEDTIVNVPVSATDADGNETITLTGEVLDVLDQPVTFASFLDSGNGAGNFNLAPLAGDAGVYTGVVTASDGQTADVITTFSITVEAVEPANEAPEFGVLPPVPTYETGDPIAPYQVPATDPNGDPILYSAAGLPQGLTIDADTGIISGTIVDVPGTYIVTLVVTDDGTPRLSNVTTINWLIEDGDGNDSPVITPIVDQSNIVGDAVNLAVIASDTGKRSIDLWCKWLASRTEH